MRVTDIIKKLSTAYDLEKTLPYIANKIEPHDNRNGQSEGFDGAEAIVSEKEKEEEFPSHVNESASVENVVRDVSKDIEDISPKEEDNAINAIIEDNTRHEDIIFDDSLSNESKGLNEILIPYDDKTSLSDIVFDDITYNKSNNTSKVPEPYPDNTDNINFSNIYLDRAEGSQKKKKRL